MRIWLKWNRNNEPGVNEYKLYVGTSSGLYNASGSPKSMGNETLGFFDIPDTGGFYAFSLTAVDPALGESPHSSEVSNTFVPTRGVGRWVHLVGRG